MPILEHTPIEESAALEFESNLATRKQQATDYIEKNLPHISEEEKRELTETTTELYKKAYEFIAPAFVGFAHHLLTRAAERGGNEKIVFVARDGTSFYQAAKILLEKFPHKYPGINKENLVYAFFTRNLLYSSSEDTLVKYLTQLGVEPNDNITIADIGMYGSIIHQLERTFAPAPLNVEFLISRTSQANGFIDNGRERRLPVFSTIPGNPAVHFLEDTFSGEIKSPTSLVDTPNGLQPNTRYENYPPEIEIKRRFAIYAIEDYARLLQNPEFSTAEDAQRLQKFLSDQANFRQIMVPHER